jgi:c-di-GMP-binding flagellar brake protein YcgR
VSARPEFQNTQPAPASLQSGQAIDDFRVTHPAEMHRLLRQLVERQVLVQLSAPSGASYTTVLWSVDPQGRRLSLDANPSHPQIRALIDEGEATAVAYLDAIKLQFELHGLMFAHSDHASALQAALPDVMYRFQRRESFRVRTRDGALARLAHPAAPATALTLRVLDVSVGGCALALPPDVPPIDAGARLADVQLELDAETRFRCGITVQHVSGGFHPQARGLRLGCSFEALDGAAQRTLQRYIDLTQRRARFATL